MLQPVPMLVCMLSRVNVPDELPRTEYVEEQAAVNAILWCIAALAPARESGFRSVENVDMHLSIFQPNCFSFSDSFLREHSIYISINCETNMIRDMRSTTKISPPGKPLTFCSKLIY